MASGFEVKPWLFISGGIVVAGIIASSFADWKKFAAKAEKYRDTIRDAAKRFGLSEYTLASLLWKESRYNPAAVGTAGEHGLGQVKRVAFDEVIGRFAFGSVSYDQMIASPELQIQISAGYLAIQTHAMGNVVDGLRAYNQGVAGARKGELVAMPYAVDIMKMAFIDRFIDNLSGTVAG